MLHLVINLDKSKSRWESIVPLLNSFGINPERIPGVDGTNITEEEYEYITPPLDDPSKIDFPRQLTKNEVGCFLAHKKCWQHLVDSQENWAMIMEDDILFSDRAKPYITNTDWIPPFCKIVQLSSFRKKTFHVASESLYLANGDQLVRPFKPYPYGCQAYLIRRDLAHEAIRASQKIILPVDDFLFSYRSRFCRSFVFNFYYRLNPAVVCPDDRFSSEIGNRSNLKKSLKIKLHPSRLAFKFGYFIKALFLPKKELFFK